MNWTYRSLVSFSAVLMLGATIGAPSLSSQQFANPGTDTWPTYNGDYSGKTI